MANRLHTPLCDTLGMEYPILLAGMAVGGSQDLAPTPVEMVAAISNAGALGVLGDNFRNLDEMDEGIRRLKSLVGDKPYGMDFLVPATRAEVTASSNRELYAQVAPQYPQHVALVQELIEEYGFEAEEVSESEPMSTELLRKKFEIVLDNKVPLFAAATGEPPEWFAQQAHAQGMKLIGMTGAVRHAQRQVAADVDIITAQGTEAGGHTGNISTFVLVPQVVDEVSPRPVLAAGGIGTGRHVAAALALGAQGCWVGTAFLVAEENNIPDAHKDQILGARSDEFTTSKFSSGKQQRAFQNAVKLKWAASGLDALPMPLQGLIQEPFTRAARKAGRLDLIGNPSGQIGGMLKERRPARDILMDMVNEAEEVIEQLQGNLR
ncbi:MAG: nitronate monooxygenase family protein [Chloroflexi bacterium]|nr:nitronate monooxygenase family protein [Chloroflexota bacterium]